MIQQLTLAVQLRDDATFANFYNGDNVVLIEFLQQNLINTTERFIYLWGKPGSGRSHLLHAYCHGVNKKNLPVVYFSLAEKNITPEILEGLENLALVCIDDIDAIAGNRIWEEALFHAYNRLQETNTPFIITANQPATLLGIILPDLTSRLTAGITFQVHELNDEQKLAALQMRAKLRGINLTREVAEFLLHHCPRDMVALFTNLEKLDKASLSAQRKLTIPFIKNILQL